MTTGEREGPGISWCESRRLCPCRNGHRREPPGLHIAPRQIAGCIVLHYSDLMTRYRGRIRSEKLPHQWDRSTRASLAESTERKSISVPSVVDQATRTDLTRCRDRTIRVGPMPFVLAAGARLIDSEEGRGG